MNRRKFIRSVAIGAAAIVVAPKLLESKPKLDGYTVAKPMIHGIKVGTIGPSGKVTWNTYTMPNGTIFTLVFEEKYDSARQYLINHDKLK